VHWTLPVAAFIFGHARIVPGFWLGFFLLVLIHEFGHAILVRRHRYEVVSIDVHGLGGVCRWRGEPSDLHRAQIAWGGVLAQAAALIVAIGVLLLAGEPHSRFTADLANAFTRANLWLIGLNLIPVPPLDGAEAWKLLPLLRARRRERQRRLRAKAQMRATVENELSALQAHDQDPPTPRTAAAVDALLRKVSEEINTKKTS
jgi:Zn-dependent protease